MSYLYGDDKVLGKNGTMLNNVTVTTDPLPPIEGAAIEFTFSEPLQADILSEPSCKLVNGVTGEMTLTTIDGGAVFVLMGQKVIRAHNLLEALVLRAQRVLEERHLAYVTAPSWETATVLANGHEWVEQLPHLREYPLIGEVVGPLCQAMEKLEEGDLVTIVWQSPDDSTDESKPVVEEVEL